MSRGAAAWAVGQTPACVPGAGCFFQYKGETGPDVESPGSCQRHLGSCTYRQQGTGLGQPFLCLKSPAQSIGGLNVGLPGYSSI